MAVCTGGVNLKIYPGKSENELWTLISLCTGISLYIPIIWLFELALIDCIVKCKVLSVLWQLQLGGSKSADLPG